MTAANVLGLWLIMFGFHLQTISHQAEMAGKPNRVTGVMGIMFSLAGLLLALTSVGD